MKEKKRKLHFQRLSVKIILTLFAIILVIFTIISGIIEIANAAGVQPPSNEAQIRVWLRFLMPAFFLIIGASIIASFAFALKKMLILRIRKLEDAAKEVAKGNYDVNVKLSGKDELSRLTDSFNTMSAELRANEYLSKEFIRNVSHEFKTPISAIRAYGELLEAAAEKGKIDKAAVKEYADIIIKERDRLTLLSKSILQLSVLDSTTIIKKDDVFSPAEQIRDIFRLMQAKWSEKNITLDLDLAEITVTNNAQLLYQVWQNLISNAIKFSNDGGEITVILKSADTGLYFEISDNGVGISDADKEKIFDHFYMADKSRNTDGSGLGLPITKKILAKLGGEINMTSEIGKGSKFMVTLI